MYCGYMYSVPDAPCNRWWPLDVICACIKKHHLQSGHVGIDYFHLSDVVTLSGFYLFVLQLKYHFTFLLCSFQLLQWMIKLMLVQHKDILSMVSHYFSGYFSAAYCEIIVAVFIHSLVNVMVCMFIVVWHAFIIVFSIVGIYRKPFLNFVIIQ